MPLSLFTCMKTTEEKGGKCGRSARTRAVVYNPVMEMVLPFRSSRRMAVSFAQKTCTQRTGPSRLCTAVSVQKKFWEISGQQRSRAVEKKAAELRRAQRCVPLTYPDACSQLMSR